MLRYDPTLLETRERCNEPRNSMQQEPKLTADMSNDEQFIKDCASGKDAYGTIASIAFNKPYEECLEFYLDENGNKTNKVNKEGKERRSISKIILLGICYGKSMKSIAEDLNVSEEKATEIYNAVLTNIPGLKNFMIESQEMAKTFGWVETKWGRRRHIPEMQLPQYDVIIKGNKNFDPFFDSKELGVIDDTDRLKQKYIDDLLNAKYYKQKQQIKEKAEKDGFKIIDNTRTISDAERQCVNCVDKETEILTDKGWKFYNEIDKQDKVLTLNMETSLLEWNILQKVNKYKGDFSTIKFNHTSFNSVCTMEHRWPVYHKKHKKLEWRTTEQLLKETGKNWCDWSLLRCMDNKFKEAPYEDWFLKIIGYYLTDGNKGNTSRSIRVSQSESANPKKCQIIQKAFEESGKPFCTHTNKNLYKYWSMGYETGERMRKLFPDKLLTLDFVMSLSQRQANILLEALMLGDGCHTKNDDNFVTAPKQNADNFQILALIAGYATSCQIIDKYVGVPHISEKVSNVIVPKKPYYRIRILRRKTINVYKKHFIESKENFVWCPTVQNGTWVARRKGKIFITGNSRVQGSAADQSKIAIRLIGENKRLKELGFKMLLLVHDEIIGECPIENVKECRDIFTECMINSAKDLRTGAKCDASVVVKWYGEELDIDNLTVEQLKEKVKEEKCQN